MGCSPHYCIERVDRVDRANLSIPSGPLWDLAPQFYSGDFPPDIIRVDTWIKHSYTCIRINTFFFVLLHITLSIN